MQKITKKRSNSQLIQIGFLLVLFGVFLCSYQFIQKKKLNVIDKMGQQLYYQKEENQEESNDEITSVPNIEEKRSEDVKEGTTNNANNTNKTYTNEYIGILEIPKIGLKRGFVDPKSIHNNVEDNITILNPVAMPNEKNGNFILAAHSGTGSIAYFNKLYQLKKHDKIYVEYQNKVYTYEIVNIYEQPKNGTIKIYRDPKKSTITLITCTNGNNKEQTVYIANQIKVE